MAEVYPALDGSSEEEIVELVAKGDWKSVLTKHNRNKLLPWVWPSEEDLQFLCDCVRQLGAQRVVSIGCGSGLLEWLLQAATGMPVKGVEVDRSWWISPYSVKFLELEFVQDFNLGHPAAGPTDALLFCYFNNEPAFLDYLHLYEGPCLIVIGPGPDRGTHTTPTPFLLPHPVNTQWTLQNLRQLNSKLDFIGVFRRL